jgi:diguanylate cyclase
MRTTTVFSAAAAALVTTTAVLAVAGNRRTQRRLRSVRSELAEVRAASLRDPLTGAANRAGLMAELHRRSSGAGDFTVALIDLDKFKLINDTLGHDAGDKVLVGVVQRLRAVVDPRGGLVGRLGGDELVVVVPVPSEEASIELGTDLVLAVAEPIGEDLWVSASIGLVHALAGDDVQQVLTTADYLMYEAKAAGGSRVAEYDVRDELIEVEHRPAFRQRDLLNGQLAVAASAGRAER